MEAYGCKLRGHQKALHEPDRLTFSALDVHWCSENISITADSAGFW